MTAHALYVTAAYGVSALAIAGLIAWVLLALSADKRFGIAGLNYKDAPENALRFLGSLGNPYSAIGVDSAGRTAIDWGVYGVPETFLVGRDGKIVFKHVGPLTEQAVTGELLPAMEKALAAN